MESKKGLIRNKLSGSYGYLSVLAAAGLFGSAFTMAKPTLEHIDSLLLSAIVYLTSGISLIPFAKASFRLPGLKYYFRLLLISILGAVIAPVLLFYGLRETAASDASILTNGEVIFTIILSAVFFGEKPKGIKGVVAIFLVVGGLFMATTDMSISQTLVQFKTGNILILASMFFWGIDNNLSRSLTKNADIHPAKIAMLKSLIGGSILIFISLGTGSSVDIDLLLWPSIIILSVFGFGMALLLFLIALKHIGTVRTMSIFSLTPIFGIAAAAIFLGESISAFQVIATAIIIIGILILARSEQ